MPDLGALGAILQLFVAFFGAYLLAVWIGLIVWTFRDVRSRTNELFTQLLSLALVVVFFIPGLLLYFLLRPRETLAEAYERELAQETMLQEVEDKQVCPVCHQKIQPDFLFCPSCHSKLKRQCDQCRHVLNLRWTICPYCGNASGTVTVPVSPKSVQSVQNLIARQEAKGT